MIEINGVVLEQTIYPEAFRENGATATRLISRDSRLEQLIPVGQPVQVTVFNPLTNRRSVPMTFYEGASLIATVAAFRRCQCWEG